MTPLNQLATRHFSAAQKIKFTIIDVKDNEYHIEADEGDNMMKAGLLANVPFARACGGNAECCTCHTFLNQFIIST